MKRAFLITALLILGAASALAIGKTVGQLAIYEITSFGGKKLDVTSTAFTDGGKIPVIYSAYDKSTSPPISWSIGPEGTKSYVLILEDPAAPTPKPFVHWVVFNIPPGTSVLAEGVKPEKGHFMLGNNGTGTLGYFGPKPPEGDRAHPYHFQVFALDQTLDLPSGAGRDAVVAAMSGHVLALGELVGVFRASPATPQG